MDEGDWVSNAGLTHQVRMFRAGAGDAKTMLAVFRSSAVYVPQTDDGQVWTGDEGGIRWIYAFSGEAELASFARARNYRGAELSYLTIHGARLLDVAVPAVGSPCGVALDVAGGQPMLFPPVRGIVPDAAAVDGEENR